MNYTRGVKIPPQKTVPPMPKCDPPRIEFDELKSQMIVKNKLSNMIYQLGAKISNDSFVIYNQMYLGKSDILNKYEFEKYNNFIVIKY